MNSSVHEYLPQTNDSQLNCRSKSLSSEENHVSGHKSQAVSVVTNECEFSLEGESSEELYVSTAGSSSRVDESGKNLNEENDHTDPYLKVINEILMEEEDLGDKPCMLHDSLALQAAEKSLYEVLNNDPQRNSDNHFTKTVCSGTSSDTSSFVVSNLTGDFESLFGDVVNQREVSPMDSYLTSSVMQFHPKSVARESEITPVLSIYEFPGHDSEQDAPNYMREKKNHHREDGDVTEEHLSDNKQFASNVDEIEPLEMYDHMLVCYKLDRPVQTFCEAEHNEAKKKALSNVESVGGSTRRGRPRKQGITKEITKQEMIKEVVDMRGLLIQCAQAVANCNSRTVDDLLLQIRQHSCPRGDDTQRLAHYLANALEARLAGTGTAVYASVSSKSMLSAGCLKAYKTFTTACPFKKLSCLLANKTIVKLATGATTLHIIDFGILYGFQWPCVIQALAERPNGPPKLRITGIDFPQPGFRPAERVVDTGRRLAKYGKRFRVPFEYNAIAQQWDTIRVEDLKIEKNELLVVNCSSRLHNVLDDTVMHNSPRDDVLNLIKRINPDMFIHGVVNGTHNMPFFVTRFREALFHFSSLFDMLEATIPREDMDRLLWEQIFGRNALNIIACEGTERIERPETYKQWQIRHVRTGFRQVPLDEEIVKYLRSMVKTDYRKEFSVDEDSEWMLQGWKGRVIHAISCWQPAQ